jgi:hypothetical protein
LAAVAAQLLVAEADQEIMVEMAALVLQVHYQVLQ